MMAQLAHEQARGDEAVAAGLDGIAITSVDREARGGAVAVALIRTVGRVSG